MTAQPSEEKTAPDNAAPAKSSPFWKKALKVALYATSALIAPVKLQPGRWPTVSLGKLAIFAGVPLVAMPLAANLFPTAEEVLAQKGYPAAMVQDLAPERANIRVRPDNIWGRAHAFFSAPVLTTLRGKNEDWRLMGDPSILGTAQRGWGVFPDVVYVAGGNIDAVHKSGGQPFHMPREDKWLHTFLHEVRHVSKDNADLMVTLAREADSDYESARVMMKYLDRPQLREQLIAYKSGPFAKTHDTVLYLTARFNNAVAPAVQDMAAANRESLLVLTSIQQQGNLELMGALDCHLHETPARACRYTLDGVPLSDLATQRLRLRFNAVMSDMRQAAAVSAPAQDIPAAAQGSGALPRVRPPS